MGCARPTTEIEPTARSLIDQGGLLGDMYRCIKRQYTAMAVYCLEDAGIPEQVAGDGQRGRVDPERHEMMLFGRLDVIEPG